jgi:UDP-glucose 4-epimerase
MFKTRIKYLPPRPGERFASSLTNMSLNNRVIKKYGKISLKNYVYSIIKNRI